ncbi:hypothetical protein S40293_01123 [Stachybotrys chartarum IBT 40293]|nr:hypothetical protein S40293_01123 [Stachybotrys chartarum IBT 40293]
MSDDKPTLRWGIIATGLISSWFCSDLLQERQDAQANHIIQAVGSSSAEKGHAFVAKRLPGQKPTVYGSYAEVYDDPNVDIVYIGTPHAFHKQNCLDAIAKGKHVLCEKSFTLNAHEAREVFAAAKEKGVFIMEAMWTRFFPLVQTLQRLLHEEQAIGQIYRVTCDFSLDQKLETKGMESRLKDPALGAGSLLEIGIYSLTWALLGLEPPVGSTKRSADATMKPSVLAHQVLSDGVDISTTMVLHYPDGRQGIATSHTAFRSQPIFCRIEGSRGMIEVEGVASLPNSFTLRPLEGEAKTYSVDRVGRGFYWEADAVAKDVAAGRVENATMPWAETIRVMELMDEVRKQGDARFPQDKQL